MSRAGVVRWCCGCGQCCGAVPRSRADFGQVEVPGLLAVDPDVPELDVPEPDEREPDPAEPLEAEALDEPLPLEPDPFEPDPLDPDPPESAPVGPHPAALHSHPAPPQVPDATRPRPFVAFVRVRARVGAVKPRPAEGNANRAEQLSEFSMTFGALRQCRVRKRLLSIKSVVA